MDYKKGPNYVGLGIFPGPVSNLMCVFVRESGIFDIYVLNHAGNWESSKSSYSYILEGDYKDLTLEEAKKIWPLVTVGPWKEPK